MMRSFLASLLLLSTTVPSMASDWEFAAAVASADHNFSVQVDKDSVTSNGKSKLEAWVRWTYMQPQEAGEIKGYRRVVVREFFDCKAHSIAIGRQVFFADLEQQTYLGQLGSDEALSFEVVLPDSVSDGVTKFVCGTTRPPPKLKPPQKTERL